MNKIVVGLSFLTLSFSQLVWADSVTQDIVLEEQSFEHIQFGKIKANNFVFDEQGLRIKVNDSASFLMQSFETVRKIKRVRFQWKLSGKVLTKDAEHESQREGDDAILKLGLLIKSDDILFNPFVPSWLKTVRQNLKFSSKDMIYLVANAKHAAGDLWVSAYNERVTMISVSSVVDKQGWNQASHVFVQPVEVVALWLMADGDDTHSSFSTQVKEIQIDLE